VTLSDGSPLIATARRGPGQLLYYGYIESASAFRFNYQYPVFWKRAMFRLSGREPLAELNRRTGEGWSLGDETTVSTPRGQARLATVPLDAVGTYAAGDRRIAAAMLDETESNVTAPPLDARTGTNAVPVREETRQVPRDLSHWVALAAVLAVLGEVGFLRYRGDL
jgi:hypothetical protein